MSLTPDVTLVIQIISFFVLWAGLKRALFDPVLRVLDEREARTSGAQREARELHATADTSEAEYQQQLQTARRAVAQTLDSARSTAEAEEQRILNSARDQAATTLVHTRNELNTQAGTARQALGKEADTLAQQLANRVMGRNAA